MPRKALPTTSGKPAGALFVASSRNGRKICVALVRNKGGEQSQRCQRLDANVKAMK
jgi:hypothetical protein